MTDTPIPTAVDTVADSYLDEYAALDPITATGLGIMAALAAAEPTGANDGVTVAALRETLTVEEELRATGAEESNLRNIASPGQEIRDTFDLKTFHRSALDLGSVGLDVLRSAVLGEFA